MAAKDLGRRCAACVGVFGNFFTCQSKWCPNFAPPTGKAKDPLEVAWGRKRAPKDTLDSTPIPKLKRAALAYYECGVCGSTSIAYMDDVAAGQRCLCGGELRIDLTYPIGAP